MTRSRARPRRVLVHVGAPKTGTSYVQDVLFLNRESLAGQGILYPADRFDEHFLAALDLMELHWGGLESAGRRCLGPARRAGPGLAGHRDRLPRDPRHRVAASRCAARSTRSATPRCTSCCRRATWSGRSPPSGRRTSSTGATSATATFLDKITDPARAGELASWFWGVQEVPDILDRWGSTLPPERVHLVTVPKPGAPRDLLWQRFSAVLGLDEVGPRAGPPTGRTRPSASPRPPWCAGSTPSVNNGVLADEDYREYVRELLAHRTLSQRSGSPRLGLPPDVRAWAVDLSESWIEELAKQGYDVVGSLDELRPDAVDQPFADPDEPVEADVADAAVRVDRDAAGGGRPARGGRAAPAARPRLAPWPSSTGPRGLWFRVKRRLVNTADDNRLAAAGLAAYRRARGSSSRSA